MDIDCIPFKKTGYFSQLICDYLEEKETLKPFHNRFPSLENFESQIEEKSRDFPEAHRNVLYDSLVKQHSNVELGKKTKNNLVMLKEPTTFTIVTGHQLNLFTGPLYFLYKIISTINLTVALKKRYPKYNFVPVYWMATEDHDFDEINYFNFKGKKLQWNPDSHPGGAVGDLLTDGLQEVFDIFGEALGVGRNATVIKDLFRRTYLEHGNLAEATRYLANELFGDYGLVIVDGNDTNLKKLFVPYIKKDIFEHLPFQKISETIDYLKGLPENYAIQVNPREINYFYLKKGLRERIIKKDGIFLVNDTEIKFTKDELMTEIETHPEAFSPNVIARPLYQETILPNLCYIGGGGELAYWLQLKSYFEAMQVPFPMLLLRNSVLVVTKKQSKKLSKLGISIADVFLKQNDLINKKIREVSNIDIDFEPQKTHLENQFKALYEIADQTDKSFLGAVKAQEIKQKKGLDNLEKRLLKAQKRKLKDQVVRMTELQDQLFPGRSLQERNLNFSELYLELGDSLIPTLFESLKPLELEFSIIEV